MYFWTHDQKVNDSIRSKLLTCEWGLASIGPSLYGQVEVTATEPFTEKEVRAMKEWISGQNSDGLGEGFEQRPIETEDGDFHVHFWNSGNDYRIVTDDEIERELHPVKFETTPKRVNTHPTLLGVGGGEAAELHSVQEVAQFIYEKGLHSDVLITREDGTPFITTFGKISHLMASLDQFLNQTDGRNDMAMVGQIDKQDLHVLRLLPFDQYTTCSQCRQ